MNIRNVLYFALLFLIACASEPEVQESPEHLKHRTDSLNRTIDEKWSAFMRSDDAKVVRMSQLIGLLDSTGYCTDTLGICDGLRQLSERLKNSRYTRQNMSNSLLIDEYDLRTDSLMDGLRLLVQQKPDTLTPTPVKDLMQAIQAADDSVIIFHKQFDEQVDSYNAFLDFHAEQLQKSGYPEEELQQKPLFRPVK
jgi:hypothetical protein